MSDVNWPKSTWREALSRHRASAAALEALSPNRGNIVVVRGGVVIARTGDPGKGIPLYSVSKSVTAMVFGVLNRRGRIGLDDPVPGSDLPGPPAATARQLMSMTGDFGLTPHEPGRRCAYNNQGLHHMGETLRQAFVPPGSPVDILNEAFWKTLGREDPADFRGQWGGWGGGFTLSARDLARLGLLVLRRGVWEDRRLIPDELISEWFRVQVPGSCPVSRSPGPGQEGPNTVYNQQHISERLPGRYSLGWWVDKPDAVPGGGIHASGKYGNYLFVAPKLDAVMAVTNTVEEHPESAAYLGALAACCAD